MKIFAFMMEKGGSGKTTLATHLAAALAALGYRVLLIDADAQAHSTVFFGVSKAPRLYRFLVGRQDIGDVIVRIPPEIYALGDAPPGRLDLIPSDVETRKVADKYPGQYDYLDDALAPLQDAYDYCIIDTGPSPSEFPVAVYLAADAILLPVPPEYYALDSLVETLKHIEGANRLRADLHKPPLKRYIVPTIYRSRLVEHNENLAALHKSYNGMVWHYVRDRVHWKETVKYHQPIYALLSEDASDATRDCWDFVRHFLEVERET